MNPINPNSTTPADLRAEIARTWQRPLYQLAALVPVHPVQLSAVLHGRVPLQPKLATRILKLLEENRIG